MSEQFGDFGERVRVIHEDGSEGKLPDVSYDVFTRNMPWKNSSDTAYEGYMHSNGMAYLTDLNGETTKEILLVVENGFRERRITLKVVHDTDWEGIGSIPYINKSRLTSVEPDKSVGSECKSDGLAS